MKAHRSPLGEALLRAKPGVTVDDLAAAIQAFARALGKRGSHDPLDEDREDDTEPGRPVSINGGPAIDIPPDIIEAAETLHRFFAERGIADWKLGNVQARRGAGT